MEALGPGLSDIVFRICCFLEGLETAEKRLMYPEMSLEELGQMCEPPIGKSGINHRLRKLEAMAQELDEKKPAEDAAEGEAHGADDQGFDP